MPALGETSAVLRPRGTEPAGEQREPGPRAEIPSLSLGGGLHPWSAKALLDLPGSPARPSSQPWGSAPTLRLQWGSSYWLKILYVLPKRVFPSSRLSPLPCVSVLGKLLHPYFKQLFSPPLPQNNLNYFIEQMLLKIHLLAALTARYLALSAQPRGPAAACSDLDLSDCQ